MKGKTLLVGAGPMAREYVKVLNGLAQPFDVVGRSIEDAKRFEEMTGIKAASGGVEQFLLHSKPEYSHAIIAASVDQLYNCTMAVLQARVNNVLVEKPGATQREDLQRIEALAKAKGASVWVAYNRRFFASVLRAKQIVAEDGGVSSYHFEFTEWSHVVGPLPTADTIKNRWLLANSTHVIDLAFYLGGAPETLSAFHAGGLPWHNHSKFTGAGTSKQGVLFSYHADWTSPGRWALEILTKKHRLYLKPIESLQIQQIGSVKVEPCEINDVLDREYKPGLFNQVAAFLEGNAENLCSMSEQVSAMTFYQQIAGYDPK